ncbi:MAG TPA: hypothetical protein DEO85_14010 [Maritimibacter sp.]|nr:hypothetical protein [Maritimibacter sp.]
MVLEFLDKLQVWSAEHKELISFVVLPFLTLILIPTLTVTITNRLERAAEKRATAVKTIERQLARELKLSEFRQKWIDELRDDLALYTARTWSSDLQESEAAKTEQILTQARIRMRMNPEDPDYESLIASLQNPVADPSKNREALYVIGQRILKREWDRLKADVNATEKTQK